MDIIMPQLGETVLEGLITTWYKRPGEPVAADESLFEVETEKVSTAIPSPVPGVVREILVDAGQTVKVGTRLAVVETSTDAVTPPASPGRGAKRKLSPVVRRLLAEAGLGAEQVQGSGRAGRITREDVLGRIGRARAAIEPVEPAPATPAAADDRVVPLNKIRRATAAHMVHSIATSAHTLQAVEVNFQNVERARSAKGGDWNARHGFTLTYLPFVCVATCEAIADFPLVNATFREDALVVHRRVNLGIAVDLGFQGLLVPVLRDANHRNLRGLAHEVRALVQKARSNGLAVEDLSGGTYTISNSGSFGTLITAPIIHQPQVAILSLDGVHKRPAVVEGPDGDAIAVRPIGVLAQSFDHRAFDGAYSAAFLRRLKEILETRSWLAELD